MTNSLWDVIIARDWCVVVPPWCAYWLSDFRKLWNGTILKIWTGIYISLIFKFQIVRRADVRQFDTHKTRGPRRIMYYNKSHEKLLFHTSRLPINFLRIVKIPNLFSCAAPLHNSYKSCSDLYIYKVGRSLNCVARKICLYYSEIDVE